MDQPTSGPAPKPKLGTLYFKIVLAFLIGLGLGAFGTSWYLSGYIGLSSASPLNYHKSAKSTPSPTPQVSAAPLATDPTANWTKYSSAAGKFSLRYNPAWKTLDCDGGYLGFGTDKSSLGVCNSGATSLVSIVSLEGDQRTGEVLTGADYKNSLTENASVNGVAGTRQTATIAADGPGMAQGNVLTRYIFFTQNRTYAVTYVQTPDKANQISLADFDTMVKSTLKFSS